MAERTFELLASREGEDAAVNGATQIRAGVMRPEIVVPLRADARTGAVTDGRSRDVSRLARRCGSSAIRTSG